MNMKLDRRVLKFDNKYKLTPGEIEQIFSSYGICSSIWEEKDQVYVRYTNSEAAKIAIDSLGFKLHIQYALLSELELLNKGEVASCDLNRYNGDEKDLRKYFTSSNSSSSRHSSVCTDNMAGPPSLTDGKNIQKMYPVILGNLPEDSALEDVYNLVVEYKPVALTRIHCTRSKKLRFCEIYLRKFDDIAHLKRKLDGFVIGGRKLIMAQPSELLAETKWL